PLADIGEQKAQRIGSAKGITGESAKHTCQVVRHPARTYPATRAQPIYCGKHDRGRTKRLLANAEWQSTFREGTKVTTCLVHAPQHSRGLANHAPTLFVLCGPEGLASASLQPVGQGNGARRRFREKEGLRAARRIVLLAKGKKPGSADAIALQPKE